MPFQYPCPISIPNIHTPLFCIVFPMILKESRNRCSVVVCLSASHDIDFVLDIATDIGCWWWCWILKLILHIVWWVLIFVFDIDITFSYWISILAFDIDIGHSYWILILMVILDAGYGYWIWILGIDITRGYWNGIVILDIDIGSWNCHCTGIMLLDSDIQYQYATSNVNADVSYVYQSRY